jgi:hypothetical protein
MPLIRQQIAPTGVGATLPLNFVSLPLRLAAIAPKVAVASSANLDAFRCFTSRSAVARAIIPSAWWTRQRPSNCSANISVWRSRLLAWPAERRVISHAPNDSPARK